MPVLWLVGGINGAGKTTLVSEPSVSQLIGDVLQLNPDDLARQLAAKSDGPENHDLAAAQLVEEKVRTAIEHGDSVLVETVLSTSKYRMHVEYAQGIGFQVHLIYVGVPTVELAIHRVSDRVAVGGHGVPEEKIRSRWKRSHDQLRWFAKRVDRFWIFSNASAPLLVARKTGGEIEILRTGELPAVDKALSEIAE